MDDMAGKTQRQRPGKVEPLHLSDYARSLGLPVFPIGIGLGLMTASWFKTGAFIFYAGVVWLGWDAYRMVFRQWTRFQQEIALMVYLLVISLISYFWVFVPASMEFQIHSNVPHYGPSSTIGGIAWQNYESELDWALINGSDYDYDNLVADI